jgi:hypothetical protein
MGSQKVPGMMVMHCNGRTYGKAYIIAFKVGLLHTITLIAPVLSLLEKQA